MDITIITYDVNGNELGMRGARDEEHARRLALRTFDEPIKGHRVAVAVAVTSHVDASFKPHLNELFAVTRGGVDTDAPYFGDVIRCRYCGHPADYGVCDECEDGRSRAL